MQVASMLRIASCVFAARAAGFRAPSSFARARAPHAAPTAAADHGVCAVLSKNARGVSAAAIREAEAALGKDHVFATATLDEAADAARTIRSRGYDTVIAGGGDGTLGAASGEPGISGAPLRALRLGRAPRPSVSRWCFLDARRATAHGVRLVQLLSD